MTRTKSICSFDFCDGDDYEPLSFLTLSSRCGAAAYFVPIAPPIPLAFAVAVRCWWWSFANLGDGADGLYKVDDVVVLPPYR